MRLIALLVASLWTIGAAAADTFVPARIVDSQRLSAMKADTLGRALGASSSAVTQDNYLELVLETSDRRITARTLSMGGGMVWAMNHPEALLVGSEVSVAFAKRGVLLLSTSDKQVKLSITRMEIIE